MKKTSSVNLDATDRRGWTALHYVACPLEDGTYDNDELVFVLGKAGAKLNVRSFDGETPLDLALANSAPKVAAMLQTLMGVDKKNQVGKRVAKMSDVRFCWPPPPFFFKDRRTDDSALANVLR